MKRAVSYKKIYIYSLWLYLIAVPLGAMNIGSFGSLLKVIGLLPVAISVLISGKYRLISLHWLYLGYVFLAALSIVWSINPDSTQGRTITLLELFLLMVSVSIIDFDKVELLFLKKALIWSSRITVGLLFMTGSLWQGRLVLSGIISEDPNYLCMYFSFGAVNAIEMFLCKDKIYQKILCIAEDLIYVYAVLLTGSRGGLLAIMVCMLMAILFSNNSTVLKGKKIIFKIILVLLLFYALYYFLAKVSPLLSQRYTIADVLQSGGTGRTKIWENGLELFHNSGSVRQVFGYGAATNMRAMQQAGYFNAAVMHNIFLETLLELGIVGVIYYIIMILNYVIQAAKLKDKFAFCVIIGFIVMSLSTSLYAFKPYINIMIFIIISVKMKIKTQRKERMADRSLGELAYENTDYDT